MVIVTQIGILKIKPKKNRGNGYSFNRIVIDIGGI